MCYPEEATFVRDKINEVIGEQSKKKMHAFSANFFI